MAKSTISLREAQKLCTAQEFALVRAAQPREIGKWTPAQLRQKVERARGLRDKWKDQTKSKKREAQQAKGRREVDAATRSRAKAALFADVLGVFQARATEVRELESAEPKRKTTKKKAAKNAASAPVQKKTSKKKAAAKKAAAKTTTSKKSAGALVSAAGKKKSAKQSVRTAQSSGDEQVETHRLVLHPGLTHRGGDLRPGGGADAAPFVERPLHLEGAGLDNEPLGRAIEPAPLAQLQAETAAKQRRINASGLRSRVRGQVSARGRRAQAKRDS